MLAIVWNHSKIVAFALTWNLSFLAGCERTPAEPEGTGSYPGKELPESTGGASSVAGASGGGAPTSNEGGSNEDLTPSCITPLAMPSEPQATSLDECPEDPEGRPTMPRGRVSFPDAKDAPELDVEIALTLDHQQHGLMFRPELSDHEGMLFSYEDEGSRRFWMKNTCLALDLLYVDQDQVIVGILRQVPPWNTKTRTVPCPAAHVLEVRAGFTETYGVEPGQRIDIESSTEQ